MFFREEVVAETKWFEMAFSISWAAVCFGKPFLREQKWDDFWFLGTTSRHICIETAMQCMNFKSSSLSMIVMLTVRRVAKGRPPTSASSPRQQTDSSWLFSRADLHTSLNPTEERDNGWWNVLPSHWLGSQPLQSRGNKKRSSHNSSNAQKRLTSVSTGDFFPLSWSTFKASTLFDQRTEGNESLFWADFPWYVR